MSANQNQRSESLSAGVPMFNQEALEAQLGTVSQAIVEYEVHRHKKTYGSLSSYELNKIKKDVAYYINSLD